MYAILYDWGSDGLSWYKREADTVFECGSIDEAMKTALQLNYTAPFEIVKRLQFEVKEIEQ